MRPYTIFLDIDGTIFRHRTPSEIASGNPGAELLNGVKEKILEWEKAGYNIILTTGRRESLREITINELNNAGIVYDNIIMGVCGGKRYLINDLKKDSEEPYAIAVNLKRDEGIGNLSL